MRLWRGESDPPLPGRYDTIDLARGLAAIAILFWHYQHFVVGGGEQGSREGYPLYAAFAPLYDQGGLAVQFFWIVSGFVFSAVYARRVISSREFFWHRVGRLYPLHLLTLLVVAGLQGLAMERFGHSLIYADNGLHAFALQVVMASGWTIPTSHSFNGPIWSVSAEVLVYGMFWIVLRRLFKLGPIIPLVLAGVGFAASGWPVANCAGYFFVGCAVFAVHERLAAPVQWLTALAGLATSVAVWLATGWVGPALLVGFASIVLLLAAVDAFGLGRWAEKIPWIADNCYGSYLWHIPFQLAVLLAVGRVGDPIYLSPAFLFFYLAGVTIVARLSFVFFEKPMRERIRRWAEARPVPPTRAP